MLLLLVIWLAYLVPQKRKACEKEKGVLQKRYTLPETPSVLVHPSRSAKAGKFDATTMSLSLLLDYRQVTLRLSLILSLKSEQ